MASKSRRNSLTVKVISPTGVGWTSRWIAVATAKKAWASMARVVQRYQERQRRTWCWSSPTSPLALAGGIVAADQQMMDSGVGVIFGQQPKPGPGVQAWPVASGAGGVGLPSMCGYHIRSCVDKDGDGVGGHTP